MNERSNFTNLVTCKIFLLVNKKRILIPIDFSKSAEVALEYGLKLAKNEKSEVSILHVVSPFGGLNEGVLQIYDFEVYVEEKSKALSVYVDKILKRLNIRKIALSTFCETGQPAETIFNFGMKHNVDLMIMGSRGGSNISKIILGSTSQELISMTRIPILLIPPDLAFEDMKSRVCFATDFHLKLNKKAIRLFEQFAFINKATVRFVHVYPPGEAVFKEKHEAIADLVFPRLKKQVKYIESVQFEASIDTYMINSESNLLILLPHEHSVLYYLFFRGHTLPIVKKLRYPVLILHELD